MSVDRKTRGWIWAAVILALLLRAGLLAVAIAHPERILSTDSGSYISPARALIESGYYSYPDGMRMPMYPALIALIQTIFGADLLFVVGAQILLGAATIYLTYRTGLLLEIKPAASLLAALLLSLSMETLIAPYYILSDNFFTFLLTAAVYALIRFIKIGGPVWLVSAALLTGLVILCRPVTLAVGSVGAFLLLVLHRGVRFWKRAAHTAVYLGLIVLLFQIPWSLRNEQVTGVRTITTEIDLFYLWGAATVQADLQGISVNEARAQLDEVVDRTLAERGLESTFGNIYQMRIEVGKSVLYPEFARFVYLTLRYDLRNFLPGMGYAVSFLGLARGNTEGLALLASRGIEGVIANYFGGQAIYGLIFLPFILLLGVTFAGAAAGVVDLIRRRDWLTLFACGMIIGFFFLAPGYSSNSRYRIPAMPYLSLLAGVGLTWLWGWIRTRGGKRTTAAAGRTPA